jgi:Glycosyl transferase family 2
MNERGQLTTVRGRARPSMLHNSLQRVVNYAHTVPFGRNRTHRQALDGMPVHRPIREHDVFRVFPCQEGSSSEPLHLTFPCSADGMGTSAAALLMLTTPFNSSFDWWSAQPAGPSEGGAPIGHRRRHTEQDRQPAVSFVLPAYNEEENITKAIDDTVDIPVRHRSAFVIVVDDGSSDRAAELVGEGLVRSPQIRTVPHPGYLGHRTSGSLTTVGFNAVAMTAG